MIVKKNNNSGRSAKDSGKVVKKPIVNNEVIEINDETENTNHIKSYFKVTSFFSKKSLDGEPTYIGEWKGQNGAWVPHGLGLHKFNDVNVFEGNYTDGIPNGNGILKFPNDVIW